MTTENLENIHFKLWWEFSPNIAITAKICVHWTLYFPGRAPVAFMQAQKSSDDTQPSNMSSQLCTAAAEVVLRRQKMTARTSRKHWSWAMAASLFFTVLAGACVLLIRASQLWLKTYMWAWCPIMVPRSHLLQACRLFVQFHTACLSYFCFYHGKYKTVVFTCAEKNFILATLCQQSEVICLGRWHLSLSTTARYPN